MNRPLNERLYKEVKLIADIIYKKPSAYKSGYIVKEYKRRGGEYSGKKTTEGLSRWYRENWENIAKNGYPVYRPTKIVNANTPLTVDEIPPARLREQIALKQRIRSRNLPAF